jgi:hypothetical protein
MATKDDDSTGASSSGGDGGEVVKGIYVYPDCQYICNHIMSQRKNEIDAGATLIVCGPHIEHLGLSTLFREQDLSLRIVTDGQIIDDDVCNADVVLTCIDTLMNGEFKFSVNSSGHMIDKLEVNQHWGSGLLQYNWYSVIFMDQIEKGYTTNLKKNSTRSLIAKAVNSKLRHVFFFKNDYSELTLVVSDENLGRIMNGITALGDILHRNITTEEKRKVLSVLRLTAVDGYEKESRRLELEKSTLTSRSELEHDSYEHERRNMKDEMSITMKEAHAAEIQTRMMDGASLLARETHDRNVEGNDAIVSKLDEATHCNERLKADNAAAKDKMISRIAELEEAEVNLKSLLDVEKIDNDANRAMIFELRTYVATHVATITRHEKNVSRLEEEVHSITLALNDAKRQMEKMLSPRTGDALEADVDELREKLSAMKGENVNLPCVREMRPIKH